MRKTLINNCLVALLIVGSAISLLSCKEHKATTVNISRETLMSESSDSLTVLVSENGRPSYRFAAPLVEGYSLAREPYREFRRGINIITYLDDSVKMVDSRLRANYAIYYSNLKLWETKGDVVVIKHDGKELYTQQLFWNATTKRIYSNVDTKIVDSNNGDVYIGEGFESDEEMKQWSFRKMKGRMLVDTSTTPADSVATKEQPMQELSEADESQKPTRKARPQESRANDMKPLDPAEMMRIREEERAVEAASPREGIERPVRPQSLDSVGRIRREQQLKESQSR